jgi:hypothetical protein
MNEKRDDGIEDAQPLHVMPALVAGIHALSFAAVLPVEAFRRVCVSALE